MSTVGDLGGINENLRGHCKSYVGINDNLINRFKTREEMFTRKKPEVSHLKIFGCPVFVHIPKEKRTKLNPSKKKGVFVGYFEVSKAFRIYIPSYHHMEISRDVTFDEDTILKKSRKCQLEETYEEAIAPIAP